MPRTDHDPEDDDEPDDWSGDDGDDYDPDDPETYPSGLYDDDGPPSVPCPHCGADVIEDAEQCPACGRYLSREDAPAGRSGAWWILMLLALAVAVMWVIG